MMLTAWPWPNLWTWCSYVTLCVLLQATWYHAQHFEGASALIRELLLFYGGVGRIAKLGILAYVAFTKGFLACGLLILTTCPMNLWLWTNTSDDGAPILSAVGYVGIPLAVALCLWSI